MGQENQVKKDSPLYEQNTLILASSQNEKLVKIEKEKSIALINAWEENEKAKAQTKAYRELCSIEAWENNMKTALELDLKKMEENLEVEKSEYTKRFKKKVPEIEKIAEAKREKIEKQKGQETIKLEKMSDKLTATPSAYPPTTKTCGCF
uniref:Remorin C-terminal domain-containing protein n=1 Tax=Noccaea caerulescens TaxID=107243 RepID=A0A1J3EMS7_NOCCA